MSDTKYLAARVCELCNKLYPQEFPGKYTLPREGFRDWVNQKTGLNFDHTLDKEATLKAWIEALEKQDIS